MSMNSTHIDTLLTPTSAVEVIESVSSVSVSGWVCEIYVVSVCDGIWAKGL